MIRHYSFRPGSAGIRPRAPVLLLVLLLVNTLGVSALAWYAMRGQVAELAENRLEADRLALEALAQKVEHALYQAMLDPMLMLRTLYRQGAEAGRLQAVLDAHDFVTGLAVFGPSLELRRSWPPLGAVEREFLLAEVAERVATETADDSPDSYAVRTFVDTGVKSPRLYALQPIGALSDARPESASAGMSEWVLIGCDVGRIADTIVMPLLEQFHAETALRVRLRDPESQSAADTIDAALSRALPGWWLEMPDPGTPSFTLLGRAQWATIAASLGLLLTIMLIGIAILWEIRREYQLVELRNRFVANVSHELKTPLSLIRMYAETLYLNRVTDVERRHEYHRVILGEAERLSRMIGDVLDFSRLRQGMPVYQLTHTDLQATVRDVLRTYDEEWKERGARVVVELEDTVPPVAHDPRAITQILLNLVDNSIKYAGTETDIVLRLSHRQDRVELQVVDFGPGLDGDFHQRLWRAIQSDSVLSEARGTGLGLALVKRVCDAHDAHFLLDRSDAHAGLTVTVSFPVYRTRMP